MYKRFILNRFILNTKNITQTIFYNSNFYHSDNILLILIILSLEAIGSPCQTLKPLPPPPFPQSKTKLVTSISLKIPKTANFGSQSEQNKQCLSYCTHFFIKTVGF